MLRALQLFFVGVSLVIVSCAAILGAQTAGVLLAERGDEVEFPVDCALVFGSAVYGWNTPGLGIVRRVGTAARLYREGKVHKLIMSGGRTARTDQSEAAVMRVYAMRLNVPSRAIALEEESMSTLQNLQYAKPLTADCSSIIGISDGFHLRRIKELAQRTGWGILNTYPADESPTGESHRRSVIREVGAALYYGLYLDRIYDPNRNQQLILLQEGD